MSAAPRRWAAELLHFWFHRLGPKDWFGRSGEVDAELRRRFEPELLSLQTQSPATFLGDALTARAAVLLFDQLPRNLYRGSADAFAFDSLALEICYGALERGYDAGLDRSGRQFLGLPLMHSEDMFDQLNSMAYFTALQSSFIRGFALSHYRMIARFGRYPHRNKVLGRKSTEAELRAIAAGHSW
jgi:uncharacterized protein (DUF924 family)